jgi:excinuclease UvrABC nuclease subunit
MRCAVYRFYGRHGVLLYVGQSVDWVARRKAHRHEYIWMQELTATRVEWFASVSIAKAIECYAIEKERPLYNRTKGSDGGLRAERLRILEFNLRKTYKRLEQMKSPLSSKWFGGVWEKLTAVKQEITELCNL